ncbi:MAG: glycoside hydrolase N-terminal domain-containing protein, partial [Lentisphaeraceae bacterium]|nr:glycoside hydrolase N-terminal domain-containing protein [Lentisphaeraceae bacterium]
MIRKNLFLLLLLFSSLVYSKPPEGLKEARGKATKAFNEARNKYKAEADYKVLADPLFAMNREFRKMQGEAGLINGLTPAERKKILHKLKKNPTYKQTIKDRQSQYKKIQQYLMGKDDNFREFQIAYLKIWEPFQKKNAPKKKLPKTTTTLKDAYPGRFVFAKHNPLFEKSTTLWYRYPALSWLEAVPLGNGSFGAMDFGGLTKDVLQFNHDTLWSPPNIDPTEFEKTYPNKEKEIDQVRQLIFKGKAHEAHEIVAKKIQKRYDVGSYQPFAELHFDYDFGLTLKKGHVKKYSRSLDMETGVATTYFEIGD